MMSPARTGKGKGHFTFDRVFPDVGRIHCTSGTSVLREYHRRDAILTKLYETGQLDLLRAFKAKRVSIAQLVEHDRHGRGGETLEMLEARRPLWATIEALLPKMGRSEGARARYAVSFRQLAARVALPPSAVIADLRRVEWDALAAAWPGSPADWNRLRAAVSRFCTLAMGSKFSAFRRAVVDAMPRAAEPEGRTPDLTPEQFVAVCARLDDDAVRAAVMLLALTGMRVGEYLSLDRTMLQPGNHRIKVPRVGGNKTGERSVVVESTEWGWVLAAVPFAGIPLPVRRPRAASDPRYRRIAGRWKAALAAEGIPDVRLHDLRHCAGQWASDAGISTGAISDLLGQKDPRMARRYERMRDAARASAAVAKTLRLVRGA